MRIAIIGAGGAGSAAARFLAQEGHAVTVYEQFALDHDKGSSYGGSRIIRRTYPDALYTRLMASAYDLWAGLEEAAKEVLFVRCGGLTFGANDSGAMGQTEQALQVNGVGYERLSREEIGDRFPPFRLTSAHYGIYQEDGGYLCASACVRAQMRLAIEVGAALRENTPVRRIRPLSDGRVALTTDDRGEESYDRLLVTAGPWMAQMLPLLNLPLMVTRQYYAYFQPLGEMSAFDAARFPVWIDADTNFYGFPQEDRLPGVKIACHDRGEAAETDTVDRTPRKEDRGLLLSYAAQRLPALQGPLVDEKICLYTNTPTEDFLLDSVPDLPGAFFCSGCSGHGFKFTILFGRILADLALDRPIRYDLTRFRRTPIP